MIKAYSSEVNEAWTFSSYPRLDLGEKFTQAIVMEYCTSEHVLGEKKQKSKWKIFLMIYFILPKDESIKNSEKGQLYFGRLRKEHGVSGNTGLILSIGSIMITNLNINFHNLDKVELKICCKIV